MTELDAADALRVGDRVELRFPARGDLVVLARLVTSAISARAGFDIEELEDLRLAVGELCLLAMGGGVNRQGERPAPKWYELSLAGAAGVSRAPGDEVSEADRLGEQILSALVDEYGREQDDGSSRSWLRKQRRGHGA